MRGKRKEERGKVKSLFFFPLVFVGCAQRTMKVNVDLQSFPFEESALRHAFNENIVRRILILLSSFLFYLSSFCLAQNWSSANDGFFTVWTVKSADATYLPEVFKILQQAKKDLRTEGLTLPESVAVKLHPDLDSFTTTTELPWYIISVADREAKTIHTQRLRILLERQTLEITLRHELFHLAQPDDWPRWRAEGEAMKFSGERLQAEPFENVSEEELNNLLTNPDSRETLQRAVATAYFWVVQGR
jgi:hypothetical protein